MSTEKTQSLADEFVRAADLIDQLNLVQTLDDIAAEHVPRKASTIPANQCG